MGRLRYLEASVIKLRVVEDTFFRALGLDDSAHPDLPVRAFVERMLPVVVLLCVLFHLFKIILSEIFIHVALIDKSKALEIGLHAR